MKRVIVAPLDWGLGHATRCIPIIRQLKALACDIVIAGSGPSLALLKEEFPSCPIFELPAYQPRYPGRRGSMVFAMASQLPHFLKVINQERRALDALIRNVGAAAVISDNRFGCFSSRVPSVFITHQSNILMPKRFGWLSPIVRRANIQAMKRFTNIWIPDYPGEKGIAGELAHFPTAISKRLTHIGLLSRFDRQPPDQKEFDLAVVLSGPEPQRTILEEIIHPQLRESGLRYHLVRGIFDQRGSSLPDSSDYLTTESLQKLLNASEVVLARSGYSTVMDLAVLGKKAILVPTPQQTEQQYLAEFLSRRRLVYCTQQHDLNIKEDFLKARQYPGLNFEGDGHALLRRALKSFLNL